MSKKMFFLTAVLLLSFTVSFCQLENEFVEVTIQDTANVEAEEIVFCLILRGADDVTAAYVKPGSKVVKDYNPYGKSEEKIKKLIAGKAIDTLQTDHYSIIKNLYPGMGQKKILLRFSNAENLSAFINEVKEIDNIYGFIVSKKSGKTDYYERLLVKKILEKALLQATYIASLSKKTIGKLMQVVQVTEGKSEGGSAGWTSYPPLSALAGEFSYDNDQTTVQIVIERKLRVRYAWQ